MKTTTSILLLFIILVQTFSSFVFDAAYSLNKSYIAENFCVNKAQPETHCDGHCYLNKQKQKEEGGDKQANETKKERFEVSVYEVPEEVTANINRAADKTIHPNILHTELQGFSSSIFHPPLV